MAGTGNPNQEKVLFLLSHFKAFSEHFPAEEPYKTPLSSFYATPYKHRFATSYSSFTTRNLPLRADPEGIIPFVVEVAVPI